MDHQRFLEILMYVQIILAIAAIIAAAIAVYFADRAIDRVSASRASRRDSDCYRNHSSATRKSPVKE